MRICFKNVELNWHTSMNIMNVRFKVFMSLSVQIPVFWVVKLCTFRWVPAFGGTCCPRLQGQSVWSESVAMLHWQDDMVKPLKTKMNLNLYPTVNTLHLSYKNQPVNAV